MLHVSENFYSTCIFHFLIFIVLLCFSIIKRVFLTCSQLSDGFLLALERLVVFLFENYPRLPKHISLQSSIALLRLTLAVSTKPVTFQRFMSHIGVLVCVILINAHFYLFVL